MSEGLLPTVNAILQSVMKYWQNAPVCTCDEDLMYNALMLLVVPNTYKNVNEINYNFIVFYYNV
jgi:hypothetical protein